MCIIAFVNSTLQFYLYSQKKCFVVWAKATKRFDLNDEAFFLSIFIFEV